jgi:hypothetical protein
MDTPADASDTTTAKVEERVPGSCSACGGAVLRKSAKFCATCGRSLEARYRPADSLRASYHFHQRPSVRRTIYNAGTGHPRPSLPVMQNRNQASMAALAFVTYALVPYLGILFCPGALLMGGLGLTRYYRAPRIGGRRASLAGVFLGLLIFFAQLVLWWVLYRVPQWSRVL